MLGASPDQDVKDMFDDLLNKVSFMKNSLASQDT